MGSSNEKSSKSNCQYHRIVGPSAVYGVKKRTVIIWQDFCKQNITFSRHVSHIKSYDHPIT